MMMIMMMTEKDSIYVDSGGKLVEYSVFFLDQVVIMMVEYMYGLLQLQTMASQYCSTEQLGNMPHIC